jgi:hypothetical protein
MPVYTDTTAYPVYATKQAILRDLMQEFINSPNLEAVLYRLNNTNLNSLADKATVFVPTNSFAA